MSHVWSQVGGEASMSSESTSSSLLKRVRARVPKAWERLLELYSPLIYSWCRKSGLKPEDSADILQEVFLAVCRHIDTYRHDRPGDTFRGWLRIITRNKIRDHFRRQGREVTARLHTDVEQKFLDLTAEEGSQPLLSGLFHRALNLIRAEFEDRTWDAFWQATVEERPTAEIALELKISQASVRQAKCRILRRLRQELGDVE